MVVQEGSQGITKVMTNSTSPLCAANLMTSKLRDFNVNVNVSFKEKPSNYQSCTFRFSGNHEGVPKSWVPICRYSDISQERWSVPLVILKGPWHFKAMHMTWGQERQREEHLRGSTLLGESGKYKHSHILLEAQMPLPNRVLLVLTPVSSSHHLFFSANLSDPPQTRWTPWKKTFQ